MKRLGLTCLGLVFAACGGGGGGGTTVDGGNGSDSAMTADAAPPVTVTGHVQTNSGSSPTPLVGAVVSVVGATPANMTTSAADGTYSLTVPAGPAFIRATEASVQPLQEGIVVAGGATLDLQPVGTTDYNTVKGQLALTQDAAKGILIVKFNTSDTSGGYGATLSAAHGISFSFMNGVPQQSSTTLAGSSDKDLVFANVTAGTTTVTPSAPAGHTCTLAQAITNIRIDGGVFTQVRVNCN